VKEEGELRIVPTLHSQENNEGRALHKFSKFHLLHCGLGKAGQGVQRSGKIWTLGKSQEILLSRIYQEKIRKFG